jgi:hypothetical protein
MSNPNTFMNTYAVKIQQWVQLTEDLRGLGIWIDEDPTILDRYFEQTGTGPGAQYGAPRTDIDKDDVTAAKDAISQVLFAYDSGAPTQKSHILKMVP